MSRSSKAELLKTVESQKGQLSRYESRFRDLLRAYKGLVKEKEALEASLAAISVGHVSENQPEDNKESGSDTESTTSGSQFVDPLHATVDSSNSDASKFKDQVTTLTNAIATLTQEKSRIESSFQADKKRLLRQHEEDVIKFQENLDAQSAQLGQQEVQIRELKSIVRTEQMQQEKERTDHAIQIAELHKLISAERTGKEELEQDFETLEKVLHNKEQDLKRSKAEANIAKVRRYEETISSLKDKVLQCEIDIKNAEAEGEKFSAKCANLQRELTNTKKQHKTEMREQQSKAALVETQMKHVARQNEERISELETKLSEVSDVVGGYDRVRQQDQASIEKLRDRVAQLDIENVALTQAASTMPSINSLDTRTFVLEKLQQLRADVELLNKESEKPLNFSNLLIEVYSSSVDENEIHKRCQDELCQVREEFERYKLRAQSVLKNKKDAGTPVSPNKEIEALQEKISEQRETILSVEHQLEEKDRHQKSVVAALSEAQMVAKQLYQQQIEALQTDYKHKVGELEIQMHRQRDRTITLLAEKEKEISALRSTSPAVCNIVSSELNVAEETSDTVMANLFEQTDKNLEGSMLHFSQELARRDVEINNMRRVKHQLESALRELQLQFSSKEERYSEQLDFLKEEIRRIDRNRKREDANLEYLKNVVLSWVRCQNAESKATMMNAIATILQFSPKERRSVEEATRVGWWPNTSSKKK